MIPMFPKISFGMIVLNGEPFVYYNLQAIYPYAHEIIVVEGATIAASANATTDGHSIDGTLETLRRFKAEADPENKLTIITRDEFWSEKNEMSQAYAQAATGDYLWQVDSDEFYLPHDMMRVLEMLRKDPTITGMSFETITFWGNPDYVTDGWFLRRGAKYYHRLFKWGEGFTYETHRPPTVFSDKGEDLRKLHWLDAKATNGIKLYHYSLLLPSQVHSKSAYYDKAHWIKSQGFQKWAVEVYDQLKNPFRVHNWYELPSWLERFKGIHPPVINTMWGEIKAGKIVEIRQTDDVERLLSSPRYVFMRFIVKYLDYVHRKFFYHRTWRFLQYQIEKLIGKTKRI